MDKKKNKIIGQAQADQSLAPYIQKYRIRVELVPTEYENNSKSPTDKVNCCKRSIVLMSLKYYPVYCFHATKDNETFSNPFIHFTKVRQFNGWLNNTKKEKYFNKTIKGEPL